MELKERLHKFWTAAPLGIAAGILFTHLGLHAAISYRGCVAKFALAIGAISLLATLLFRSHRLVLAVLIGLEALYCSVAFTPLPEFLMSGLIRDDHSSAKADAVYVFSSVLQNNGDLGDVALSRLLHGLEVMGERQANQLILSELPPPNPSYADPARRLMTRLGVQHNLITVGPVNNSKEEAMAVASFLKSKGWKTVVAVTSPLHSHRACALLEREGLNVICSPSLETRFTVEHLVATQLRLIAFGEAVYERVASVIYHRRGWL